MLNLQQRGDRKANNYLENKEAIFRKHGTWLLYEAEQRYIYVPIMFLHGVKTPQELQEKLKQHCGSGE
jgi:hypothetical protein